MPPATPKYAYGSVALRKVSACPEVCAAPAWHCPAAPRLSLSLQYADLLDVLDVLCPSGPIQSRFPLTFEAIKQVRGWVQWGTLGEMLLDLSALPWLQGGGAELASSPVSLSVPLRCVLQAHGFVVYRTQLPRDVLDPATLGAPPHSICDRGYVMLQQVRLREHTVPGPALGRAVGPAGSGACAMPGSQGQPGC